MMQSGAFFPTLRPQDILDVMRQMEIPISEEDLEKPTPQRVQIWYEAFLYILKGISLEQLNSDNVVNEVTEYPVSHQEDIFLMSFYQNMATMLQQVGIDDFSLRDMLYPEPGRVRRILSSVCNFAMFRDDHMHILEKYTGQADEQAQRLEMLQVELDQTLAQIAKIQEQREREKEEVVKLSESNNVLREELKALSSKNTLLVETVKGTKAEKEELHDKIVEMNYFIANLQGELALLKARVVHSPEKIQQAIAELNDNITQSRQQVVTSEESAQQLAFKITLLEEIAADIRLCNQQMSEAEATVQQHEDELRHLARMREEVNQILVDIRNSGVRKEQLTFQNRSGEEKIDRLQKSQQAKRELTSAKLEQLKRDRVEISARLDETIKRSSEQRAKFEALQGDIRRERSAMDQEANDIQSSYDQLRQQTLDYQDSITHSLEDLLAILHGN
ncbi:kinetochore-associated Ndc80 complex subunit nuf2 [Coemansia erecta]|uniref:Kinetochore-associated Ndc80 complex subunit nuf2 n=1 Tax=Coemansia erecta TaxID=147472 RepID=A0A9W8CQZ1_9FUNG|nr:kinetochore-associated Ndc80 complex subunit nuf2 [Coemansia erecta]